MGMGGGLCQWGDVMKVRHCLGRCLMCSAMIGMRVDEMEDTQWVMAIWGAQEQGHNSDHSSSC
jgi:hypothetical protein